MSQMLLVNPRRRRRRSPTTRRRRRSHSRRTNPRRRRSPRRSHRRHYARRRRNPAPRLNFRGIKGNVMHSIPGAIGALGLDVLLGVVPIPAQFKTGLFAYATKGIGAVLVGMAAGMVGVKHETAARMTEGALTVMLHGALKGAVAQFAPQIPLSAYMDDGMGYAGSGWDPNYGMGAYLEQPAPPSPEEMGAYTYDQYAESGGYY